MTRSVSGHHGGGGGGYMPPPALKSSKSLGVHAADAYGSSRLAASPPGSAGGPPLALFPALAVAGAAAGAPHPMPHPPMARMPSVGHPLAMPAVSGMVDVGGSPQARAFGSARTPGSPLPASGAADDAAACGPAPASRGGGNGSPRPLSEQQHWQRLQVQQPLRPVDSLADVTATPSPGGGWGAGGQGVPAAGGLSVSRSDLRAHAAAPAVEAPAGAAAPLPGALGSPLAGQWLATHATRAEAGSPALLGPHGADGDAAAPTVTASAVTLTAALHDCASAVPTLPGSVDEPTAVAASDEGAIIVGAPGEEAPGAPPRAVDADATAAC
jgi:hypothetical protein